MAQDAPELAVHKEWLGQIQQVGLVVSPHVLAKHNVGIDRQQSLVMQARLREIASDTEEPGVNTFLEFATQLLEWPEGLLAGATGGPDIPESLTVALPEHDDRLSPDYAIPDLALISIVGTDASLDKPNPDQKSGWRASPHARLERLLRETNIPIGLLFNHTHLRLVYAPRGESSGHLTFRFRHLLETLGRPMAGALYALLGADRVTDVLPDAQRLPALLKESRKYQNVVSTKLADQVLEALWHLLRGFQRANDDSQGALLADVLREDPQEVYGGLLSTLMRLVFVLYAEDRGLMPASDVYQKHYAVSGLFERLREDAARYPDTMDARFGAWAQLLALFRLIHDGGGREGLRFPPRHGRLFSPDAYPFIEGRPHGSTRVIGVSVEPPRVPDGVVFRVLQNLLMLDGERLSYRALDVEQIGSVYEAMMGFALQQASGPSIAVRPKHIVINLAELLEQKAKERVSWLQNQAELKITGEALAKATNVDEALAALGKKVSREYTPAPLGPAVMYLQPTEERRRSGSHYTPRSLTEPVVRTTFRPIFERLGEQATPEQILDLKVCDPAMGSGAFLVEACRLLARRLVRAWEVHRVVPTVPDDEGLETYARRLVAERCLYGVDKNVFAVDLAKLSLWLATLAREHPFTFLDHALRHGDSLVGLTREQIACFNWEADKQLPLLRGLINERVREAQTLREQIQAMATSDDVPAKARLLREANEALDDVRRFGDLVVSAFFERQKPKDRHLLRKRYASDVQEWLGGMKRSNVAVVEAGLQNRTETVTFHWEIEFPEVFTRDNAGFDAIVGNPPFLGGRRTTTVLGETYRDWLAHLPESSSNADLCAYFFRHAFAKVRQEGLLGLIATNTIGQGDTRSTGLRWICTNGGNIYAATRRVKWPGASAVTVSLVHVRKGETKVDSMSALDGVLTPMISAFLSRGGSHDNPATLKENEGKSFIGNIVLGMGFTFDDDETLGAANRVSDMHDLLAKDPRNAECIFPYIGGAEFLEDPQQRHRRYVINFGEKSEEEARLWPDLMNLVESKVKPERLRVKRKALRERWWQFAEKQPALHRAMHGMTRVLMHPFTSTFLAFGFVPSTTLIAGPHNVFVVATYAGFCVLQSRIHEGWVRFFASSMEDRLRYTTTDCFHTFPFSPNWLNDRSLEAAGKTYYDLRGALMVRSSEGLTKTYNRFHDPDEHDQNITKLRELHAAMDRAVLDAYGWADIQPICEFILDYEDDGDDEPGKASKKKKPWRYRWPDEIRDEVLGRLLALNAERAAIEGAAAAAKPPSKAKRQKKEPRTPLLD